MKTTTDMIHDLVARGFELPVGLEFPGPGYKCWALRGVGGEAHFRTSDARVHDLIAMHFARQMDDDTRDFDDHTTETLDAAEFCVEWSQFMGYGDSATAVKVLWEAVCGG